MLSRYSSAVGAGAVVTAFLIYGMQWLIGGDDSAALPPKRAVSFISPLHEITPPPPPTRTPPEPPAPRSGPPDSPITIPNPTTDRTLLDDPATPPGPPDLPAWPDGRPGPWAADSELVAVGQTRPPYPYDALVKGLEGYVVVEFTVTRRGEVDDVKVVESSHREFERAAVAAVARARYRPRVIGGTAVDVPGQRTRIAFRLDD